jgi:hypothetical protein
MIEQCLPVQVVSLGTENGFFVKWLIDLSFISAAVLPNMEVTFGGKLSHSVPRVEIKNLGNYYVCDILIFY